MIYLDNSSTTFIKPKNVQKAVQNALQFFSANPGRGGHRASLNTAMQVESVRERVAKHVGTAAENIIFTSGCTDALNLAILGSHKRGGHVVCTCNEHNSVARPLEHLKLIDESFSYTVAQQTGKVGIVWEDIERVLRPETYLVIVNHISNVNGDTAEVERIGENLKNRDIIFLVDGAQSGGHFKYDMQKMGINMLSLAPHKGFYAPQGVGALCLCGEFDLSPIRFGGTGTNSLELVQPESGPERFESGTIATPAILGFGEGIKFVEENFSAIQAKMEDLTTFLHYEFSKLPVEIYTKTENTTGVFAFNIPWLDSSEVANYLDEKWGICVRGGFQCAALKHFSLGTDKKGGVVRVSLSFFNTYQEIERLVLAIKTLINKTKNAKR